MNSMLRQYHVRFQELRRFLRSYDPAKPVTPQEWAKTECAGFEPGMLIFFLEAILMPASVPAFSKNESEINKTFRAKDLSIVVTRENSRAMAVNITVSNYELRFLEVLLLESARKAVLEGREFFYVIAKPTAVLSQATIAEIEHLGNVYAHGGSRRGVAVESSSQMEPATALLTALGVRLTPAGGRPVLDIGAIFHMLFAASGQTEDKNRVLLQTAFTPIVYDQTPSLAEPDAILEPTSNTEPKAAETGSKSTLFEFLTNAGKRDTASFKSFIKKDDLLPADKPSEEVPASLAPGSDNQTYKHLAEALSGLMATESQESSKDSDVAVDSAILDSGHDSGFNRLTELSSSLQQDNSLQSLPDTTPASDLNATQEHSSDMSLQEDSMPVLPGTAEILLTDLANTAEQEKYPILVPSPSISSTGLASLLSSSQSNLPAQEPIKPLEPGVTPLPPIFLPDEEQPILDKMVEGTTSLSSKLEQQVARAAKKLAASAEEIKRKLNLEIEQLSKEVLQDDKNTQAATLIQCDSLIKTIEQLAEDLRLKIAETAHTGRQAIQLLQSTNQDQVDGTSKSLRQSLLAAGMDFQTKAQTLVQSNNERLLADINAKLTEFKELIESKATEIKSVGETGQNLLEQKGNQFSAKMSEEEETLMKALERNVRSMNEEVENSKQKAEDKLQFNRHDFEQTIDQAVTGAELSFSQLIRSILVEQLLPKLQERREIVIDMTAEMAKAFGTQSQSKREDQLTSLQVSLASACQQLAVSSETGHAAVDAAGKEQQSGLDETFKETDGYMVRSTAEVLVMIDKSEQQVAEIETAAKKLAEMSSLDADPYLSEERNAAQSRVQGIKMQIESELERIIISATAELTQTGQESEAQLNNRRLEETKLIRQSSEDGLNQIKEALQEAFSAVQTLREKYME